MAPTITAVSNYEPLRLAQALRRRRRPEGPRLPRRLPPLARRIAVLAAQIDFAVDDKLAEAAMEALQTYQWSKRHAKHPDGAGLRPYVSEMQRVVEKTINHRAKHAEPAAKELTTA